ncbi:MAG: mechanosensitive ion channel family protein [Verrucomicrobiota bacterium]
MHAKTLTRPLLLRLIPLALFILLYFLFGGEESTDQWSRKISLVFIWLIAGSLLTVIMEWGIYDLLVPATLGGSVPVSIRQFNRAILYLVLSVLIVHFVFEKSVIPVLTALGAGGVVIGLAAQRLIADVFNGLAINADGPFRIGDWIAIDLPGEGLVDCEVQSINWRTTTLLTVTDKQWIVPNHLFGERAVLNHWRPGKGSWIRAEVVIDFETPSARVESILQDAGTSVLRLRGFDPACEPTVLLREAEERGVRYSVAVRFLGWGSAGTESVGRSQLLQAVLTHLYYAGITPAYEKEEVVLQRPSTGRLPVRDRNGEVAMILSSQMPLFQQLTVEESRTLLENSHRIEIQKGQVLVQQGEEGSSMFVLLEGLTEVFVQTEESEEVKVDEMGPGEFFGEMSLLTGDPRSATVRARTAGVVYEITKGAMTELLEKRPELLEPISQVVAERRLRMRKANESCHPAEEGESQGFAHQLMSRMRTFFGLVR